MAALAVAAMTAVLSMSSCASWTATRNLEELKGTVLVVTDDHAYQMSSVDVEYGELQGEVEAAWEISGTAQETRHLKSGDDSPAELAGIFDWKEAAVVDRSMIIDVEEIRQVRVHDPESGKPALVLLGVLAVVGVLSGGWYFLMVMTGGGGRPLRVRGRRCVTPIAAREDWIDPAAVATVTDEAARRVLVAVWSEEAQAEHAAVAAFSKLSLELLALGAPPRLVAAANRAALQEIHHARLCFGLASAYSGERIGPGPLPQALEGDTADPLRIAHEALLDGCILEGTAAEIARIGAETARDPVVARVLRVQAIEESQHAALAWSIVEWCLESGGDPMRRTLRSAIAEARMPRCDDLPDHGRVSAQRARPVFESVVAAARARLDLEAPVARPGSPRPPPRAAMTAASASALSMVMMLAVGTTGCSDDGAGSSPMDGGGGSPDAASPMDGAGIDGSVTIDAGCVPVDADVLSPDAAPPVHSFSGTLTGPAAAAGSVGVLWIVETANYGYSFGTGISDGVMFSGGLSGDPPPAARNMVTNTDLGVAVMVLMSPCQSLPEGMYPDDPPVVGVSARHALIYRGSSDVGTIDWSSAFPFGLSCGVCVDGPPGEFDSYVPVDCASFVIETDLAAIDFCNWT